MDKQTQNMVVLGGLAALAYYLYTKNSGLPKTNACPVTVPAGYVNESMGGDNFGLRAAQPCACAWG